MDPAGKQAPESVSAPHRAAEGCGAPAMNPAGCACIQCGYALQGLPAEGLCPECARPVAESLGRRELRYADRGYLKRLSVGLWLITSCTAYFCVGYVVLDALRLVQIFEFPGVVLVRLSLLMSVFGTAGGVWLLTGYEPRVTGEGRLVASRRVARVAVVWYSLWVLVLTYLYELLMDLILPYVTPENRESFFALVGHMEWWNACGLPAFVVVGRAVLLAVLMHRACALAKRVPDAVLVRRCELFGWLLPLLAVLAGGWIFVPASGDDVFAAIRLLTPTSLILGCVVLRWVHGHILDVFRADVLRKTYASS